MSELLRRLCRLPEPHARFLNTLSLLEGIGARKILLSQDGPLVREKTLRHLAEETRHAHFFRRAAERAAGRPLDYAGQAALAAPASRGYLARLDAAITRSLGRDRALAYPYVTLAVERRALWLYRLYERTLREEGSALTLRGVLADEGGHLEEIVRELRGSDPRFERRSAGLSELERPLFARWLDAIERDAPIRLESLDSARSPMLECRLCGSLMAEKPRQAR